VSVTIHDFRVTDRVLAETEPDAGDVVYLGLVGSVAYPFVVVRRLSGPGGVYIDAIDVCDADGSTLGTYESKFELDGESKAQVLTTELRDLTFPSAGTYTLQYSIFDDVVANYPFTVVQQHAPGGGIVPGPLDAALAKSTIAWIRVRDVDTPAGSRAPYEGEKDYPVWYGFEDGVVYVLVGEGEQHVPGLTEAARVRLVARSKDKRSQVADVECSVRVLPKDGAWTTIASELLAGRRLNLQGAETAVERWKKDCEIVALAPLPPPVPTA